jgi:transcriptional regulator with XRE-family HTH domain
MKDRVKQFIDNKGISAGELALMIDVQRSSISHILNGRNKPSAMFIEKMLDVFPDLNARWLLTGSGEMLNNKVKEKSTENELAFDFGNNEKMNNTQSDLFTQTKSIAKTTIDKASESSKKEPILGKTENQQTEKIPFDNSFSNQKIEKVIILYKDGSFASYNPR